jgi:hypothetical protein
MNREALRNLIRKELGETTASFWSNAELNTWIDLAGHDVAKRSKCIKTNGYLTTIESTGEYGLTGNFTGILAINEVYYYQNGTRWKRLTQTSRERLSQDTSGWMSASDSTPQRYYWDIEEDIIGYFPKPNSTNAGTNYSHVYYSKDYTDMSSDTSEPTGVPRELQLSMVDFVVATGYKTRGWGDKSNDAWNAYYGRIKNYISERSDEKEEDPEDRMVMRNYRNIW